MQFLLIFYLAVKLKKLFQKIVEQLRYNDEYRSNNLDAIQVPSATSIPV